MYVGILIQKINSISMKKLLTNLLSYDNKNSPKHTSEIIMLFIMEFVIYFSLLTVIFNCSQLVW